MCGIIGGFWKGSSPDDRTLMNMGMEKLTHRGPDDQNVSTFRNRHGMVMLGHTRLSIIDLSPSGNQPMTSQNGRFTMVFNGEIYNYRELREELMGDGVRFVSDSDTEVLLEAWTKLGETCLPKLIGMFAFAVQDHLEGTIVCARDPFGIKPLFYTLDLEAERFFFASEVPALIALKNQRPAINWQRAYDYLEHGLQDGGNGTFIEDIDSLPPAHLLRFDLESCRIKDLFPWWRPNFRQKSTLTFGKAAEELREIFLTNVRLHLRSDVPVGAALSGGIDSSAIVCAMRHIEPKMPIHTFSYIARGTEFNEESWVDLVNEHVNAIPHKVFVDAQEVGGDFPDLIRTQGEPFNSTSMYAQFRIFKEARECGIPVILEGQGADELLAGYEGYPGQRMRSLLEEGKWRLMLKFARDWKSSPGRSSKSPLRSLIGQLLPEGLHAKALMFSRKGKGGGILNHKALKRRGVSIKTPWMGRTKNGKGRRVVETLAFSLSDHELPTLLRFGDRNSMRFSVENRVPFLTVAMADFLLSLPENYLISDSGVSKRIFRAAMRGIVPDAILDRSDKIGFVTPMQGWVASGKLLLRKKTSWVEPHPILNVGSYLAELEEVVRRNGILTPRMWRALNFIQWIEEFDVKVS